MLGILGAWALSIWTIHSVLFADSTVLNAGSPFTLAYLGKDFKIQESGHFLFL